MTQQEIASWCEERFGPVKSKMRVAARANEEMAELLRALSVDDNNPKAALEIADVVIILTRLANLLGVDLQEQVSKKMAINQARVWKTDGTGHGYHVREKA